MPGVDDLSIVPRHTVARKSVGPGLHGTVPKSPSLPKSSVARKSQAPGYRASREEQTETGKIAWLRSKSRALCDNWRFNVLTTVLTFYALFGDDFRLSVTHKQMDILFNILTIISCCIFTFEIVASSLGQDEYFLGFFFMLDVGSTATLILDLTWIANAIFCQDDAGGALRTSRAGRAGARASRTVRIIRLMRLAKLYKAYKTNLEAKKAHQAALARHLSGESVGGRESVHSIGPGDDEDLLGLEDTMENAQGQDRRSCAGFDALPEEDKLEIEKQEEALEADRGPPAPPGNAAPKAETRVGKKLSDMTTRRVIILVLVMLFCMPQFTPSSNGIDEFLYSSNYGADAVYDKWRTYCGRNASAAIPWCLNLDPLETPTDGNHQSREVNRAWFERALLNFIYQHHRGGDFAWKLFWVGVNSTALVERDASLGVPLADRVDIAQDYLSVLMQLNQELFVGPNELPPSQWDLRFTGPGGWDMDVLPLSAATKQRITEPWMERCSSFVGVSIQPQVSALHAEGCSTNAELRCSERELTAPARLSTGEEMDLNFLFTFDMRGTTRLEAGLSMLQTIFICFAVGLGAMSFSKDANELLLNPIERMIAKMETIKDNPLEAMRLGDLEYRREEVEQARWKEKLAQMGRCMRLFYKYKYMKKVKEPMETVMLEKTIIKLGGLLALGFGEAGAEIVGRFTYGSGSTSVNICAPGAKVDAVFGFCTIRNFEHATQVLGERVMIFVNQVGEIVHGCADDYHGAPNKNIGDSFMIVWRLSGVAPERQAKLADMAVMAFVKILAEINKSRVLATWRKHPGLLQRVPGFQVQMGFGLHAGWAIEGAIGSEYKIDASYLSPNVHVAHRLELATSSYSVWMLISDVMMQHCSTELAALCRLIDHVTVKGSRQPIRLHTLDLDAHALSVVYKVPDSIIRNRFKIRQLREVRKNDKWNEDFFVPNLFNEDPDVSSMRARFSKEFFHRFSMAYRNYEAGEWLAARDMLFTCDYMPKPDVGRRIVANQAQWPEDGPGRVLLLFMKQFGFKPPADWPGHRELPLR